MINFSEALIRRKKARKIKDTMGDASYKFKSKLVVTRRDIQFFTETVL